MTSPPTPRDETTRLEALFETAIVGTAPEHPFDEIARQASLICGTPMAAVTLIGADEQWFKAKVGLAIDKTSREDSFCGHGLEHDELIVPNAQLDPRFMRNPLVTGDAGIRFYAGMPINVDGGSALGMLCVLDRVPRKLEPEQLDALRTLAHHLSSELRQRREANRRSRAAASDPLPVSVGDVIGEGWHLVREIGRGGLGVVFEARSPQGEQAAIKVLLPQWMANHEVLERFTREARILATLRSPHTGRLYKIGNLSAEDQNLPYLVLEYLKGKDLQETLNFRAALPWREATAWIIEACAGLEEAHSFGITHRDLKPSNIFLADNGQGGTTVKVVDFGIAKTDVSAAKGALTQVQSVIGSVFYMSPEQMTSSRNVDLRTDIWALGILLFEMVSGRLPFEGTNQLEVCVAVMSRPPLLLRAAIPGAPVALERIVSRCLERDRNARYKSARELASDLRQALAGK
ncbi:MAG: GAF domain-containing protein [Myxococcaceae bacterium]|nr:MAG: GAF domain-containing protein [Myxococcaceae bacterium]